MKEEARLLEAVRRGSQDAPEMLVRQYSAYVVAVVRNRSGGYLSPEDEEELASDVFLALWQQPDRIRPGALKGWLARVADRRTVDRLRRLHPSEPLDERLPQGGEAQEETVIRLERVRAVRDFLDRLPQPDREIFRRFYDLNETTDTIAAALSLHPATVRTRLRRGRARLQKELCQGGLLDE